MKVLIVEDEKNIALGIADILRSRGTIPVSIRFASDGQDAWDSYRDSHIDLIITDIRMQQMNGLDMMELFYKQNKNIQFIVISGYDNFSYAQRAIRYDVIEYLLKPVDTSMLLSAVQKAYDKLPENYQKKMNRKLPDIPYFQFKLIDDSYPGSLKKLIEYLQQNYMLDISLQSFCLEYMKSTNYLSTIIKKYTGQNFSFLIDFIRLSKASELLLYEPDLSISEISYLVGYNNERRLYQAFQKRLGCTPGNFRQSAAADIK
ncbi:response regulator [Blautia luti]|uniref:Stage 0 sporulation protein A homolog n=1 Tax=Blautia luti TaxID=89014 RepID=A0A564W0I2_9FIRM|nr:response regulator [Blautia luti]VUX38484.1 putative response regulatory protein [Blautia luti]